MTKTDPVIECIAASLSYGTRVWAQHVKRAAGDDRDAFDAQCLLKSRRQQAKRIKRALMRAGFLRP